LSECVFDTALGYIKYEATGNPNEEERDVDLWLRGNVVE